MKPSVVAAFFSRLGVCRALTGVVRARSSRSTGNATKVFVCLPRAANPGNSDQKNAVLGRSGRPVLTEADAAPAKREVSLKFDAVLLLKVDAATRRQGITRTAWLHCAAFDALGE